MRIIQVTVLEQAQEGEELAAEEGLAASVTGQRGQRAQHLAAPGDPAVVAFHAPDGDDGGGVNAVGRLDPLQQPGVPGQHGLAVGDTLRIDQTGQVIPDGGGELRLRIEQFQHLRIGYQAICQASEVASLDTGRRRRREQRLQAGVEGRSGGRGR